ncbi:Hypothetical protein NTJ_08279 [Nesidiocoris tenuis]|uniref:Uncharacterized protein n=1 Tax=Nesidiocoris tenuis TaxID=355587 RepID=A0ABN7ATD2_9HEMI|nr:Hypothetical protein NTJ_08279 [Nesidiocoris tenuis]
MAAAPPDVTRARGGEGDLNEARAAGWGGPAPGQWVGLPSQIDRLTGPRSGPSLSHPRIFPISGSHCQLRNVGARCKFRRVDSSPGGQFTEWTVL